MTNDTRTDAPGEPRPGCDANGFVTDYERYGLTAEDLASLHEIACEEALHGLSEDGEWPAVVIHYADAFRKRIDTLIAERDTLTADLARVRGERDCIEIERDNWKRAWDADTYKLTNERDYANTELGRVRDEASMHQRMAANAIFDLHIARRWSAAWKAAAKRWRKWYEMVDANGVIDLMLQRDKARSQRDDARALLRRLNKAWRAHRAAHEAEENIATTFALLEKEFALVDATGEGGDERA